MKFLRLVNGVAEPYTLARLKSDHPRISFPSDFPSDLLAEYGVHSYADDPAPAHDPMVQSLVPGAFRVDVNGNWFRGVVVENLQAAEASMNVRAARDEKLTNSDWSQLQDAGLSTTSTAAWADYRAALRDITNQAGFPYSVTWPTQPQG